MPCRPQEENFVFMPANGSALTALGWAHHRFFQKRDGTGIGLRQHPPVDGVRATVIDTPNGRCAVGLTSEIAAVLGGKIKNPCTDLGLRFSPLSDGEAVDLCVTAWFVEGGLLQLRKKWTGGLTQASSTSSQSITSHAKS